jgi:hypothetical protein
VYKNYSATDWGVRLQDGQSQAKVLSEQQRHAELMKGEPAQRVKVLSDCTTSDGRTLRVGEIVQLALHDAVNLAHRDCVEEYPAPRRPAR